ncbi:uncharacterized protein LOC111717854 [Eurytemora carolleeae]|uniref:uncharacterized protein LOC111717854 n=1 Tax=Eurytemora carolleeae TaxID=1294199 RepID=UPI000C764B30|nr:uncharacterized protein LOC111717854 [Eurytemora carolleeae]|eukprot:XP_023349076.1 uncharacterized protein LOC111717854 [Eurytemora affinis]
MKRNFIDNHTFYKDIQRADVRAVKGKVQQLQGTPSLGAFLKLSYPDPRTLAKQYPDPAQSSQTQQTKQEGKVIFVAERETPVDDKKEDFIQKWQNSENISRPGTGKVPSQESKEELVDDSVQQDEQDVNTPIEQQNEQRTDEQNETLRLKKQKIPVFKSQSKGPNPMNRIGPKGIAKGPNPANRRGPQSSEHKLDNFFISYNLANYRGVYCVLQACRSNGNEHY